MTIRILSAAQMQWADQQTMQQIPSFELMGRAGQAVAEATLHCMPDFGRVVIVAGPGNNGGDGYAAACYLRRRRLPVTVVSLMPLADISGDAHRWMERAREAGVKVRVADTSVDELKRWLLRAMMVVDCIFGTGLARPVTGRFAEAVALINDSDRLVLSVDIASGIHADSGAVMGCAVQADCTLPIAAHKWGHWLGAGRDYAGDMLPAADIGISDEFLCRSFQQTPNQTPNGLRSASLIDASVLSQAWPARPRMSHKGNYGHVWIFGGSVGFTGAPRLAGLGAFAAGAGLVSIVCPDQVWPVIAANALEIMVHPHASAPWQSAEVSVDAIVAGPGWGRAQGDALQQLLATAVPLLLDADALNMLADDRQLQQLVAGREALTVLTPHPGEAARLLGSDVEHVQTERRQAVLALAGRYDCWIVLKGNETLVASPQGEVFLCPFGSPQMAVAGCGDVLAGVIAAQLIHCRKGENAEAIVRAITAAVALHGKAGELAGWHLAGELANRIGGLRQEIERQGC